MHLQKWQKLFTIHVGSSAIGQPLLGAIHILMERGARTILLGAQNFLRGVFRDAIYPKDIWHGDAMYPRIFCRGVPKIGGVEYLMSPVTGYLAYQEIWHPHSKYPRILCTPLGNLAPLKA